MGETTGANRNDDAALVRAARGGDRSALAELLVRHRPLVRALCERALGDPDLAEDATQEASLQAMLDLDRLRRPDRFGPWLAGIGLNVCRRWRRARARDAWSLDAVLGGRLAIEPLDRGPGPAELAEIAEERALVRRAVAALPPGQRAAVVLFYLGGLPLAESAALLGIAPNAAKARLHKARASLRRTLAESKESEMDETISRRTLTRAAGALAGAAALGTAGTAEGAGTAGPKSEVEGDGGGERFVEMRVVDVRRRTRPEPADSPAVHAVVLAEVEGDRRLPIWMGSFEAEAIALRLEGIESPRPMTYAFAVGLLAACGGRLREVRIERLTDEVFYAAAIVEGTDGARSVDARPSDALNLALLAGAPILVAADVLDRIAAAETPEEWRDFVEQSEGREAIAAATRAAWQRPPDRSGGAAESEDRAGSAR